VKVYIASRNAGKIRELKAIFAKSPLRLSTYRKYEDVLEVAGSYAGNALLKAQTLAAALRDAKISAAVLADDSGLEIDALGGRPGVYSARFGGPDLEWPERRIALLEELRGIPPYRRTARFVCALAFVESNREAIVATGRVDGYILESQHGTNGFGYDALFLYPPLGRSFATLSEKEKNAISHRRVAADALLAMLGDRV
jgi:XTP/dITP diphosphohydrolase